MAQYRKKPVVIDAHRWNPAEKPTLLPDWLWSVLAARPECLDEATGAVTIRTLEDGGRERE